MQVGHVRYLARFQPPKSLPKRQTTHLCSCWGHKCPYARLLAIDLAALASVSCTGKHSLLCDNVFMAPYSYFLLSLNSTIHVCVDGKVRILM